MSKNLRQKKNANLDVVSMDVNLTVRVKLGYRMYPIQGTFGLQFFETNFRTFTGQNNCDLALPPIARASSDNVVDRNGKKRRFSTNKSLYLGTDRR